MLTAQDNATIVRSHLNCFNSHDIEKGLTLVSKDVKWTNIAFDRDYTGQPGYREYHNNWFTAMPDYRFEIVNLVSDDQLVVVEMIARGTHTGPLAAPQGTIPASQKKLSLKVCELFRLEDGLIVESRVYFDSATMLRQLGVSPTGTPTSTPPSPPQSAPVPSAR